MKIVIIFLMLKSDIKIQSISNCTLSASDNATAKFSREGRLHMRHISNHCRRYEAHSNKVRCKFQKCSLILCKSEFGIC